MVDDRTSLTVLGQDYPPELLQAIADVALRRRVELYVVGGTVRDWLKGAAARDLDLAVSANALGFAEELARLCGGTYVLLDAEEETARVVWRGYVVDVASFRKKTADIRDDLTKRDFTINSLALAFNPAAPLGFDPGAIIDPTGGVADLRAQTIRACSPDSFTDDPLRLLRAFRFHAETGFVIDGQTMEWISSHRAMLAGTAPERVAYELDCLMTSDRAYSAIRLLRKTRLLEVIFPELLQGDGVAQPSSHHLDVFSHNLEALRLMEEIIERPGAFYPEQQEDLLRYLAGDRKKLLLKWAALFHDLGKPAALKVADARITFYNHDRLGADLFAAIAGRLRWSREKRDGVARFISLHMWPFHLCNVRRKGGVTPRACLKLFKASGKDLPGLFLLAMADSLAGQGPGKPSGMEEELAGLFGQVLDVCRSRVEPVLSGPPLLSGRDLIDAGLVPGPAFKEILEEAERVQVEGVIRDRQEALAWLGDFLASR